MHFPDGPKQYIVWAHLSIWGGGIWVSEVAVVSSKIEIKMNIPKAQMTHSGHVIWAVYLNQRQWDSGV